MEAAKSIWIAYTKLDSKCVGIQGAFQTISTLTIITASGLTKIVNLLNLEVQ